MGHRGPRGPLREYLRSPKGHFGDCRFSLRKTHIGPQGPPKVTSSFHLSFWGGKKTPKGRFRGRRVEPKNRFGGPFGPFWALEGPKSRFSEIPGGTLKATVSHKIRGAPQGPPKERFWSDFGRLGVDFGATLGVHGSILGSILHRLGAPCGSISRRFSEYIHADVRAHKHTHKQTNERTKKPNVDRYIQCFNLRGLTTGRIRNIRTPAGSITTTRPDRRKDPKPWNTCRKHNNDTQQAQNNPAKWPGGMRVSD